MKREQIKDVIYKLGSDHTLFFANHIPNGILLQQDLNDVTELIEYLQNFSYDSYLEIGAAAGGMCYVMNLFLKFNISYTIDNNNHHNAHHRTRILKSFNVIDVVGDSHDPNIKGRLLEKNCKFDIIYIDGDHSYDGVRKDIEDYLEFLKVGGFLIFHDALYHDGVIRNVQELKNDKRVKFLNILGKRFGNAVFRKN